MGEKNEHSNRRGALAALAGAGVAIVAMSGKAKASAFGEENAVLAKILVQAQQIYKVATDYADKFNAYADKANKAFVSIDKTSMLIERVKNINEIVEEQRQEINSLFSYRKKGDWTKFRVKKLDLDGFALISEIKYLSWAMGLETKRVRDAELTLAPRTDKEKEEISGRRRVMSRVGHAALQVHQGRLFYQASKQATEERRKAVDGSLKLDGETKAKAFALDSVPEILELQRQQLRQLALLNEQTATLIEILGLKRPMSSREDYIPTEDDFKKATDKTQDGNFDWSPGSGKDES